MMKIFVIVLTAYILIGCLVTIVIMKLFEIGVKERDEVCMETMENISEDEKEDKNYQLKMQIVMIALWPYMLWVFMKGMFCSNNEE